MSESDNIVAATNLHKSFGKGVARVHVLRGLDLNVARGEFLAVMGPSGCGKSTLLHVLGLMTPPDNVEGARSGGPEAPPEAPARIVLDGEEVRPAVYTSLRRRKIGFVFQRFNLLSVLSAQDNVAISLRVRGLAADDRVAELFGVMGIAHLLKRKPGAMSIGEQQRVAVVRALAHRPALLLADEPTGNLDSENARSLLELFRRTHREERQTIVMITHSAEAAGYADRVVRMRDGKILHTP